MITADGEMDDGAQEETEPATVWIFELCLAGSSRMATIEYGPDVNLEELRG